MFLNGFPASTYIYYVCVDITEVYNNSQTVFNRELGNGVDGNWLTARRFHGL